jgi:hypothetical protein
MRSINSSIGTRTILSAPTLRFRQRAAVQGAFFARDVELGQDATATFEDGFRDPNEAPIAHAGGPYSGFEGQPIALSAGGSSDPEAAALAFAWDFDANGTFGDATGSTPTFTFPNDGTYPVAVRVTDPLGLTDTATSVVVIENVAPLLTDDFVRVLEDSGDVTIHPLANDSDWDPINLLGFTQPAEGTVTQLGNVLVLSLPPNFNGTSTFEVSVSDGAATSTSGVTVVSDPVPDAPEASDHSYVMSKTASFRSRRLGCSKAREMWISTRCSLASSP